MGQKRARDADPMEKCAHNNGESCCSCFDKNALKLIIGAYNKRHLDRIPEPPKNASKKQLWGMIQEKLEKKCGEDETCWLEQDFLRNVKSLDDFFKPLAPLGRYQWLTTDDIYKVMSQYDSKYSDFKFYGPVPMDFLRLGDPDSKAIQDLNLANTRYKQIGIIFNLDPSDKSGSHWVAMNINIPRKEIGFFDSYGEKHTYKNQFNRVFQSSDGQIRNGNSKMAMPPEVQKLVERLIGNRPEYTLKVNTVQHQYANSECGVYSMMFILNSRKKPFEAITQEIIVDEIANQYRNKLFRT